MFICNRCKKVVPDAVGDGMKIQYHFQYGSQYDGDIFDMAICKDCADVIADKIRENCQIDPLVQLADYGTPQLCAHSTITK